MTILQRYGLFTVVPGVIVLLIFGFTTCSDPKEDPSDDPTTAPNESSQPQDESAKNTEQPTNNKQTVPTAPPEHANPAPESPSSIIAQKPVAQLAMIAQQANQNAKQNTPDTHQETNPDKDPTPLALNEAPPENADSPQKNGPPPIPKEIIVEAIEAIKPAAQDCYDTLLHDFPDAAGTVRLKFVFETEDDMSRVQMSEVVEDDSTLFDRGLHDCLSEAVSAIELPRPPHDNRMTITYPFVFRADNSQ